ncbi:MAG: DUF3524 domain-containing protein, partial [bacterium]
EPFYGGSHKAFLDGLAEHSSHDIVSLTLPEGEWRRRMRRGAQELLQPARNLSGDFDCLIASDMLDLPAFLAFTRPRFERTPVAVYFHENQMTYPRLKGTKFNSWFGQINYHSALAADSVMFNSEFHRRDFVAALRSLAAGPNNWLLDDGIAQVETKSGVLPIGVDLAWIPSPQGNRENTRPRTILWNHRWEFDKAPELFLRALRAMAEKGIPFELIIAGEPGDNPSDAMLRLPEEFGERVRHFGFAPSRADYARLLAASDIAISTTRHEFFGIGMVEAMSAGCIPLAPARYNYPALVPESLHSSLLWQSEADLIAKLERLLVEDLPGSDATVAAAQRFTWENVGPLWDHFISRLSHGDYASVSGFDAV